MTKSVEKLTPEQDAILSRVLDKWAESARSTKPMDRNLAKIDAVRLYQSVGLEPPEQFIFCDSPMAGAVKAGFFDQKLDLDEGEIMFGEIFEYPPAVTVQDGMICHNRRNGTVVEIPRWLDWQVSEYCVCVEILQVTSLVQEAIGVLIAADDDTDPFRNLWNGSWEALACDRFMYLDILKQLAIDSSDPSALSDLAANCSWFWPAKDAIVIAERPAHIYTDELERLHCENDAAILYPDGWGVYAWHGVRVPESIIRDPASITLKQVEDECSVEIKQIMIERYRSHKPKSQ